MGCVVLLCLLLCVQQQQQTQQQVHQQVLQLLLLQPRAYIALCYVVLRSISHAAGVR